MKPTPSKADFVRALKQVLPELSPVALQMLRSHYQCPGHRITARALAELVGFKNYRAANIHYGKLAATLAKALGWHQRGSIRLFAIAEFVRPEAEGNDEWIFVMRPQLAGAMEQLGLVRPRGKRDTLRIVTWNCRGGPAPRKLAAAMSLEPDVLVMPEFPRPGLEVPGRMVWAGPVRQRSTKGILAYADAPYGLRLLRQARRGDPRECLGLEVEGPTRFNLLAIWAKQDASTGTYVESLKRALKLFEAMFSAAAPTVVVGDLNSNSTFSRAGGGHDQFVKELDDLGLVSAYHRFTGEAQGQETQSTFRHMGSNRGRYHIDHCFIPKEWVQGIKVEVECPDGWRRLSDHSPLIVDVKLPAA